MNQSTKEIDKQLAKLRPAVWGKTEGLCWYCGKKINPFEVRAFAIDHFVPRSLGGSNNLDNLVPSCCGCNSIKGNRPIEDFRRNLSGATRLNREQLAFLTCLGYEDIEERILSHVGKFQFWFDKNGKA